MKKNMLMISFKFTVIGFIINSVINYVFNKIINYEYFTTIQVAYVLGALGFFLSFLFMVFIGLAHRKYKHKYNQLTFVDALIIALLCIVLFSLLNLLKNEIIYLINTFKEINSVSKIPWYNYFISPAQKIAFLFIFLLPLEGQWLLFRKANQPGWACLVPIYNVLIMLKISNYRWHSIFLLLVPIVNIVFAVILINTIMKKFGKNFGFTLGLIFLPFIFYPIIGFGKAEYEAKQ